MSRPASQHPSKSTDKPVLIYDGDCSFCTSCVNWINNNLLVTPTSIPWQRAALDELGISSEEAAKAVWLITDTHHHSGHLAAAELLRRQPTLGYRFLGNLLRAPGYSAVAALGYALVSRFRHRLPGGTPACNTAPVSAKETDAQ